ncbi:MAG: Gfo/Idh/MocA family oxidoreductase [Pseudomonadota bacterium]
MPDRLGVGIVGCGNISSAYFKLSKLFNSFEIIACSDINEDAARARAEEFDVRADSVDDMLAADDIDIVVNLTVPAAHFEVSKRFLKQNKHVYAEKPFVLSVSEGQQLAAIAADRGVRIGSAPDTFLGGAHQLARHLVDRGDLGKITSGTCHVMSHGMEHWHPNPDFFFKPGGGPILDLGAYYISNLVQLIGPVKSVAAMSATPAPQRTITSQPRAGETITVETPTTFHALLEFENNALVTLGASWDVWENGHGPMELYGEKGSLFMPDPNYFAGEVRYTTRSDYVIEEPEWEHPLGVDNEEHSWGRTANYRAAGLADMAQAIKQNRRHRCSLEFALHVVEVMTAILHSSDKKRFMEMETRCERPEALSPQEAQTLMA